MLYPLAAGLACSETQGLYFFVSIRRLASSAAFFLLLMLSFLTFFWLARFFVDLGDLSPMIVCLNLNLSFNKVLTKVISARYKFDRNRSKSVIITCVSEFK